jgi:hypothetical protein
LKLEAVPPALVGAGAGSACFWASRIQIHYSQRYGSRSGFFPFFIKVLSEGTEIRLAKLNLTENFINKLIF